MPQANKPALVSGPGALSQRTDGGAASKQALRYVSGMPNYGDGQELMDMQKSAPMAQTNNPAVSQAQVNQAAQQPTQQQAPQQVTPLLAPTQRPNEPVTAGSPVGPGPGPEALGLQSPDVAQYQTAKEGIQALAANPSSSPALRALASKFNQRF